jgi:hypothetical protein
MRRLAILLLLVAGQAAGHLPLPVPRPAERLRRPQRRPPRPGANLSGAELSSDRALLAVDTHTTLYVYQAADPSLPGAELVADLISRPRPGRSSSPARAAYER